MAAHLREWGFSVSLTPWFSPERDSVLSTPLYLYTHFPRPRCGGTSPMRIVLFITRASPKFVLRYVRQELSTDPHLDLHIHHPISILGGVFTDLTLDGMPIYSSLRNFSANVKHFIDFTHHHFESPCLAAWYSFRTHPISMLPTT